MSIAVSTVVYPSRILLAMTGAMVAVAGFVAIAIAAGLVSELPLSIRLAIASLVLFLSFFGFYHGMRNRKPIHIDISGTGQIRLLKLTGATPCADKKRPHVGTIGELVRLLGNSTIWPHMLLLRFQSDQGEIMIVPVFPDSLSRDGFRALSVACRWMAVRKDAQNPKISENCSS